MGDEDHTERQLPHRVRGAPQSRPAPSASPALSDDLRRRMHAAVSAERARATGQDPMGERQPGQGQPGEDQPGQGQPGEDQPGQGQHHGESARPAIASAPADNGLAAPAAGQGGQASRAGRASQGSQTGRPVKPEPVSQPGPAVEPERKVRPGTPEREARPERAARPRPAAGAPAIGNAAADRPPLPRADAAKASARRHLLATSAIAVALVILAAGCLGVAVARYVASSARHDETVSPAEKRAEAASRRLAANWVSQHVSHVFVACDQQMCAALTADGFPSRDVRVLGPTAPYPLTSAVVIVTQAVRDLFGSSLSSDYAPAILATFGSADASITVRVIAPHGAAAYQAQLGADLAERKATGSDLVQVSGISVSAVAKKQLVAGQPDARLLLAIASLASRQPVDILDFGNIGPGADPDIPLRFADLAESDPAARTAGPAYLRALRASLGAVSTLFRPTSIVNVVLRSGQPVLRIEFTAPTPLTLLTPKSQ
jgi:hypothetical protein